MGARWLNEDSRTFLSRDYLAKGQSAEERIRVIANRAEEILKIPGFADKVEKYALLGWNSFSTPEWINFGTDLGLPASCNGSHYSDNMDSILMKTAEIGKMTQFGAGTSAFLGDIRPRGSLIKNGRGGKSDGPVRFAELLETVTNVVSQGSARRGSCAIYLPIDHADVDEFLDIRSDGNSIQNLSIGVTVTDEFMEGMIAGDKEKQRLWLRVIKKRTETGYPYVFFTDTVNRNGPKVYRDKGMKIKASNLCSEITQPATEIESFVCFLLSLNWLYYDEWKGTDFIETMVYLQDAVIQEYIDKTAHIPLMKAPHEFAKNHRAMGLGVLGWHSLLQSKSIAFESFEAKLLNVEISKYVYEQAFAASRKMAAEYGEAPIMKGTGQRHATLLAIAPTSSSSFILGQVSPSIEPYNDNYFVGDLAKGKFSFRNPYLKAVLAGYGKDTEEVWMDIAKHGGSALHLDFLTEHERNVFKTFGEISQKEIVVQASQRQKYIDQSQSLNLMIHPDTPIKDINALMIEAWRLGVKTLYYQKGTNPVMEHTRNLLNCVSCEA